LRKTIITSVLRDTSFSLKNTILKGDIAAKAVANTAPTGMTRKQVKTKAINRFLFQGISL
jgi:hypothetical protein